ncbi:MAG: hypothetical protein IK120_03355 [Muribaculaceae bacterium]|nr:hypothetical protein [Muribaculaceae bacterium]
MALIPCEKCGNLVSDKAVICPKCGWKVNVAQRFDNNINQGQQYPPQPVQYPQQPYAPMPQQGSPYWPEEKKRSPIVPILLAIIAVLLIGGGVAIWWFLSNKSQRQPDDIDLIQTSTATKTNEPYYGEADPSIEDEECDIDLFTAPEFNYDFTNYVFKFVDELKYTGNQTWTWFFSEEISKSKVSGKQAKYDGYNGIRYQYFFDRSPNNHDGNITGIAISVESYESDSECSALDNALTSRGYEFVKSGMWRAPNGLYISPGFTADRVYAYIYYPNAPDKSSAPRRY